MKLLDIQTAIGAAILLLSLPCEAKYNHGLSHLDVLGKRHSHKRATISSRIGSEAGLKKRSQCEFPTDAGLVAVPGNKNGGWAMSPDQECVPDSFCPFACPPGKVMNQWNPDVKTYPNPKSMDGGLYCNKNGEIVEPYPGEPYCVDGTGAMKAHNNCHGEVSWCQTILPGNEAMIIPTRVVDSAPIAVPGPKYWLKTSAHYYINGPGVPPEKGCIWGDGTAPIGNWAPYVAGANTDDQGITWTKLGWNPEYMKSHLADTLPSFGLKIICDGDCPGLPCSIDPSSDGSGGMTSDSKTQGDDGMNFCVVTVPKGVTATVVSFDTGDAADTPKDDSSSSASAESTTEKEPESSSTAAKSTTTTTAAASSTTTTASASTTPKSKVSSTTSKEQSSSDSTTSAAKATHSPHILFEVSNSTTSAASLTSGSATFTPTAPPTEETSKKSAASAVSGSIFSLLVVFVAATYML